MLEQTGDTYQSSQYAKALLLAESKIGKTVFAVASALGQLPWQKQGGVVDDPRNLHVLAFDANAVGGVKRFLLETCSAPPEALNFRVYNMQEDYRRISASKAAWDYTFYNTVMATLKTIEGRAKGVPVILFSSLTSIAEGFLRGLLGPASDGTDGSMSIPKWDDYGKLLINLRNVAQQDNWHCIWEAHVFNTGQGETRRESMSIPGRVGSNYPNNVEQVFRIRREVDQPYKQTKCDKTYLDTRPTYGFVSGGRNFTEALEAKEYDMTSAFLKLGLKVGHWGAKKQTTTTEETKK